MSLSASPRVRPSRLLGALLAVIALVLLALPASGRADVDSVGVFSPNSYSFASTLVGGPSTEELFELRNEGPGVAEIFFLGISGPGSVNFSIEHDNCMGAVLDVGSSCSANVIFAPTTSGRHEALLEVFSLGADFTEAPLEGFGLSQELTVSPSPLAFPATTRYMSSEKELTVENNADVPVKISGTNFEGPGAGAFGINGSSCAGTLAVGSSCTLDVRFNPQSEGEQRAFLHLGTETPGGGPTIELQGLGAAPELRFEPGSFDFGITQTSEGGSRTNMVLRNVGLAPAQVGIETRGGNGAFSIGNSDCWGATLAPGGTCSLQVEFRPNETGFYAGEVQAASAGANFDAELTGRGGKAIISASPDPTDFGSAAVGSRGEPRTITLRNSGDLAGGFFIAIISGGDSASFQLIEENCTGIEIGPGGTCQAVVRFQPTAAGLRTATLSFFGDGEGGQQVRLSGNGVAAGVPTAAPASLSFGARKVGASGPVQAFTFTNSSGVTTELGVATLGGDHPDQFRIAADGCSEATLAPGASCQVGVRFAPEEAGAMGATLRLGSTGGVATAALSGYAEAAAKSTKSLRVGLRLAGRPLHLDGSKLRVGALSCPSQQNCQVTMRATIVKAPGATGGRPLGPWSTKLTIPAGTKRELVLGLDAARRAAAADGRLRLRWESTSGSRRGLGSAEVSLR